MKINAVSSVNNLSSANRIVRTKKVEYKEHVNEVYSVISFKGGNKNQAILFMAESEPYFKTGGVATVMTDARSWRISDNDPYVVKDAVSAPSGKPYIIHNSDEYWAQKNKALVDHIYNGKIVYDKETGLQTKTIVDRIPQGLPDDSSFKKYEGKLFLTTDTNYQKYDSAREFFEARDKVNPATGKKNLNINKEIHILEDVTGSEKKIDFGGTGETEIKLYRVLREGKNGKLFKTNDFKIFTDVTAPMQGPYKDGGYATSPEALAQSWRGDSYARSSKAFTESLERICEIMSEGGEKFDPATIILNDSQVSYTTEYMAEKAAKGGEFWQGKKPTMIVHNAGDGYIQRTSSQNMFLNIADKEVRMNIEKDPKFIEALKRGNDAVQEYFDKLLPQECFNGQHGVSPFTNTLYYADLGYVGHIHTVSEGYAKALIENPELSPGSQEMLKKLAAKGKFTGIINGFDPLQMDPYTVPNMVGYSKENHLGKGTIIKGQDGYKTKPFVAFDSAKVNKEVIDINHVRDVKRQNKISLLERFDKEVIEKLTSLKNIEGHETDLNVLATGMIDKTANVYGYIDPKYVEELKKPKGDVKLLVSWGRCDAQKGMDSVLEAFEKYASGVGKADKNTVLVLGGAKESDAEFGKITKILDRMAQNPDTKGRFVYLDGFAPNKVLAGAADFAVLPSRFAPCELTDLESMNMFCTPIVTNIQGLAQKNFDASFDGEAEKATSYKTKHGYDILEKDLRETLSPENRAKYDKEVDKFKKELIDDYKLRRGKELSNDEIMKIIRSSADYNYKYNFELTRPYRDGLVVDELVNCFERALIKDRNADIQTKMVHNGIRMNSNWENNGALSETGKSSMQLIRERHINADSVAPKESDTLLYKIKNTEAYKELLGRIEESTTDTGNKVSFGSRLKKFFNSKGGKWTAIGAGVVAVAGITTGVIKSSKAKRAQQIQEEDAHLSALV